MVVGVIVASLVIGIIGFVALAIRMRYLEKLCGDLLLEQIAENAKYLEKTLNNMKKEN